MLPDPPINTLFGRLRFIQKVPPIKARTIWEMECSCGTKKLFQAEHVKTGRSKSCGCFKIEETVKRSTTHGKSHTWLYYKWQNMIKRCTSPSNKHYDIYGGRGIKVCERWLQSYANFEADIGYPENKSYTIDRIDPNGNYEPSNVRWATPKQQANNKRNTKRIMWKGSMMTIPEIADLENVKYSALKAKLDRFSPEIAVHRCKNPHDRKQINKHKK